MATRKICIMEYVVAIIRLTSQKNVLKAQDGTHSTVQTGCPHMVLHTAECLQNIFLAAISSHKIVHTQNVLLAVGCEQEKSYRVCLLVSLPENPSKYFVRFLTASGWSFFGFVVIIHKNQVSSIVLVIWGSLL